MKHLVKRRNIIITTADKGGAVVIMDPIQTGPTLQQNKMMNDTLDRFKNENLLSKKTAEGLKLINPKTEKCYITPKIQKENNPGKPVINSINCHTSEISLFDNN